MVVVIVFSGVSPQQPSIREKTCLLKATKRRNHIKPNHFSHYMDRPPFKCTSTAPQLRLVHPNPNYETFLRVCHLNANKLHVQSYGAVALHETLCKRYGVWWNGSTVGLNRWVPQWMTIILENKRLFHDYFGEIRSYRWDGLEVCLNFLNGRVSVPEKKTRVLLKWFSYHEVSSCRL